MNDLEDFLDGFVRGVESRDDFDHSSSDGGTSIISDDCGEFNLISISTAPDETLLSGPEDKEPSSLLQGQPE
jgi:hypothetical protein